MRILLPIALAIAACTQVQAGPDTARWEINGPIDLFTTDELGNLYILNGNDLNVFDRTGKPSAHNSLNTFGPITGLDAFYSLKPMIFSRPQGRLAVLDNTLSFQGSPLDLSRRGFPQVTLACSSVQSRFWFFDDRGLTIQRVDGRLVEVASTGRLDQLLSFSPQPTYMEEADGRLYVVDPDHGVLLFDLFGTFIRTLNITGPERIQVRNGWLWYVDDGRLYRYDLRAFHAEEVPWPEGQASGVVLDARIEQDRLYRRTAEGLVVDVLPL